MVNIKKTLSSIAKMYPKDLVERQMMDVNHIAFDVSLVLKFKGLDTTIVDIGGGIGMFSVCCAALGMKAILKDDFQDRTISNSISEKALQIHRLYGVEIVYKDIIKEKINLEPRSVDVVTCFHAMEHLHHSPKKLFNSLKTALKENGLFVLCTPNCCNLRKRISVPFGHGKWSSMEQWYEPEIFRGHVREPDVDDLLFIARDLGLKNVKIFGRNWLGYGSKKQIVRIATKIFDYILRPFPSLCSDIYMIGFV